MSLHRMHEMPTIVTDVSVLVSLSVSTSVRQSLCHAGSFGAAFSKSFWPFVLKPAQVG